MRRSLVLTNESARHPFRRSLPPRVTALSRTDGDDDQDWKLFMLSFTAFFVSFYGFIV